MKRNPHVTGSSLEVDTTLYRGPRVLYAGPPFLRLTVTIADGTLTIAGDTLTEPRNYRFEGIAFERHVVMEMRGCRPGKGIHFGEERTSRS